jgi:chemotaxis protein MotA
LSTSAVLLTEMPTHEPGKPGVSRLDLSMLAGIAIVVLAVFAGIMLTGVRLSYFLQPTGGLIVLGGTLGVTFVTTPRRALVHSARRAMGLIRATAVSREALIDEILSYIKVARPKGVLAIEGTIDQASDPFLKECLMLTLDIRERTELQAILDIKIRLRERQGEADAKTLEVAGGFAPTIGVIGTVVGLIDVLRQFSDLNAVAYGIGTAFVSTVYGLALANFILLPAAHRIRARVAESFEIHELIAEGSLCLFDRIHPSLVRERLNCFLREPKAE